MPYSLPPVTHQETQLHQPGSSHSGGKKAKGKKPKKQRNQKPKADVAPPHELSNYELLREQRIASNHAHLVALGLAKDEKTTMVTSLFGAPFDIGQVSSDDNEASSEEESDDKEEEAIVAVLRSRKMDGMLLVHWSTGKEQWAKFEHFNEDVPDLVNEFMEKKKMKEKERQESGSTGSTEDSELNPCNHSMYQAGVTYRPEENASYFNPTSGELHGTKCSLCEKCFVHELSGQNDEIHPSAQAPVYSCANREAKKCFHSVCFDCFQKESLKDNSTRHCRSLC